MIQKDWRKVRLRMALCYPNVYRVGMTSLAVHLLYWLFNSREDVVCERVFYVSGEVPRSLESGQPLSRFDVIAFSLQFESDFVHAIEMLVHSNIPPLAKNRTRPFVIAGGPCSMSNPFPVLPFIDAFLLGDIEPVYDHLLNALIEAKSKEDLATILNDHFFMIGREGARRSFVPDLNTAPHPRCQVLPDPPYPPSLEPTFGQSLLVEISRGCDRQCNFCMAGFHCGPRRERRLQGLLELIDEGTACSAVEKVALLASAFVDYSQLTALLTAIVEKDLFLSVPSLRADIPDLSIFDIVHRGGQRTLTFAPEAGTLRLRKLIAKPLTDDVFHHAFSSAISSGFNLFKLYFIIGLPSETNEDIKDIIKFCDSLLALTPRRHRLHVSVGVLIPKAHTPFQWMGVTSPPILRRRITLLRQLRKRNRIILDLPNIRSSLVQAVLSRGATDISSLLLAVAQEEQITTGSWFRAAKLLGFDLESYATTPLSPDTPLPWEVFDVGVKRNILLRRYQKLD